MKLPRDVSGTEAVRARDDLASLKSVRPALIASSGEKAARWLFLSIKCSSPGHSKELSTRRASPWTSSFRSCEEGIRLNQRIALGAEAVTPGEILAEEFLEPLGLTHKEIRLISRGGGVERGICAASTDKSKINHGLLRFHRCLLSAESAVKNLRSSADLPVAVHNTQRNPIRLTRRARRTVCS